MSTYPVMLYVSAGGDVVPASETDQAFAWRSAHEWRTKDGVPLEPVGMCSPSEFGYKAFREAVSVARKRALESHAERLATIKRRYRVASALWERLSEHAGVRRGRRASYKREALLDILALGLPVSKAAARHAPEGVNLEQWKADLRKWVRRLRKGRLADVAHLFPGGGNASSCFDG